ncbi:hypothetical protein MHF_0328 [Mycoplasma haemofelis Ohio2]|uniref:Uncharacterized protein n=1 Tax=Mycoplasma haemofelis (strain Ohio2) TaxID=859194 RepID=F6FGT4_MYCHI|nr:hypothetical protein MHF_0328 [Mycoplasma haemofelis Ohio2]
MNPIALKGAAGALGMATVAGVVKMSVGSSTSPQLISSLLEKNHPDKRLLFKARGANSPDWKRAWQRYVASHSGTRKNPFSVSLSSSSNGDAPVPFMEKCEALFKEKVQSVDDDKYEQALEYCTRDTLVSDFVWTSGKQLAGDGELASLWKKYFESSDDFWNLKSGKSASDMHNDFKTKCSKEFEVKTGDAKHPSVSRVINYCSKDRPKES